MTVQECLVLGLTHVGMFTLGVAADEWRWRRRHGIERAEAAGDADRAALRAEAEPLLQQLAELAGVIEMHAPGKSVASVVLSRRVALHAAAARLQALLDAERQQQLAAHVAGLEADDGGRDRDQARDAVRALQRLVLSWTR